MRRIAISLTLFCAHSLYASEAITEIVVTSERRPQTGFEHIGNIAALSEEQIRYVKHSHINELLTRVPGVWINRGSGQENLMAFRSPVLTGAGSCGAFLTLEDGIPTRPSGFCNVNQLFELNTELAKSVEVIRGPGTALYGSNALHGTINIILPGTADGAPQHLSAEVGPNNFYRLVANALLRIEQPTRIGFVFADDGGFREDSGYRQLKAFVKSSFDAFGGELTASFSASDLDQQTAGYIIGEDAYKDSELNRQNLNPEAFRLADSQRLSAEWHRSYTKFDLDVRPFVRHSDMTFLQHFLPGKPLEENGHTSAGVLLSATTESDNRSIVFGADVEWANVFLLETQVGPTEGSAFLQETRPQGTHYDFDVTSLGLAPFVQARFELSPRFIMSAGLRAEFLRYDYTNRMLTGNTRDDGTVCGFGGCLYTRPASREDGFSNVAPKLGALFKVNAALTVYANLARGFRVPQTTELYRLQSGQLVSDLDSEQLDSLEIGLRAISEQWSIDASAFAMQKRNSIFRDSEGFNVSGGKSRHHGVEVAFDWRLHDRWLLQVNGTYARHVYDFDTVAARGEVFVSGNDVDTAPRWLGSAELRFDATNQSSISLQWTAIGSYFLDAENRFTYPGHDILNLFGSIRLNDNLSITARVRNLGDKDIADRADYAFGNYRYFPGRGRELYLQIGYAIGD